MVYRAFADMRSVPYIACIIGMLASAVAPAMAKTAHDLHTPEPRYVLARGATCKSVGSCREAVELWCRGYARADADDDGVPCENICYSRQQVDQIRAEIGC